MQNMSIDANGKAPYKSMSDCFVKSVKSEGFLVLWKGFTPAFVKLGGNDVHVIFLLYIYYLLCLF